MKKRKRRHMPQSEFNPRLKVLILQVVDNQIADYDEDGQPLNTTYVKGAFDRLSTVHGLVKAKEMIAAVLLEEMYDVIKYKKTFNETKYKTRLEMLR